jgi:hypothetical protein
MHHCQPPPARKAPTTVSLPLPLLLLCLYCCCYCHYCRCYFQYTRLVMTIVYCSS